MHSSRVTFIARLTFDKDERRIAEYASQLPLLLRVALAHGFNAAVAICVERVEGR